MPLDRAVALLDYQLDATRPSHRHLSVTAEFPLDAWGQDTSFPEVFLPVWTPGSYLVREYSRHLGRVLAEDAATGVPIACEKVAKNRLRLDARARPERIRLRYIVYAHELSVRTADLTDQHAYWNHACLLLWPATVGPCRARLEIHLPPGWTAATALPPAAGTDSAAAGTVLHFAADDLDHAVDSPFLAGCSLQILEWRVLGVVHRVALDGLGRVPPPPTLQQDLTAIIEAAAAIFGGRLPYEHYVFQCLFTARGHGGLEHSNSTTLLASRTALHDRKGYCEFLSLAAHELFHAWNVKRMRPREFWCYDYEQENYTSMLWLVEGWTAYYDDLLCLRAGRFTREEYLDALAVNLNAMRASEGRFRLSLAESSFDAWIRLYRPDENTRNSSQNYYTHGAAAAACLDLTIRLATGGDRSLDDVIRTLYASTYARGRGFTRDDVDAAVLESGGAPAVETLRGFVDGVLDPDAQGLLGRFGVDTRITGADRPFLGISFEAGGTIVASVHAGSPADLAGIAPGDEILAIQGLRVDSSSWQDVYRAVARVGQALDILWARRGIIGTGSALPTPGQGTLQLSVSATATPEQLQLRDGWLRRLTDDTRRELGTSA